MTSGVYHPRGKRPFELMQAHLTSVYPQQPTSNELAVQLGWTRKQVSAALYYLSQLKIARSSCRGPFGRWSLVGTRPATESATVVRDTSVVAYQILADMQRIARERLLANTFFAEDCHGQRRIAQAA